MNGVSKAQKYLVMEHLLIHHNKYLWEWKSYEILHNNLLHEILYKYIHY